MIIFTDSLGIKYKTDKTRKEFISALQSMFVTANTVTTHPEDSAEWNVNPHHIVRWYEAT